LLQNWKLSYTIFQPLVTVASQAEKSLELNLNMCTVKKSTTTTQVPQLLYFMNI